jgi:transcription factor-like protein
LSDVVYAQSASSFPPQDVFLQVSEFYEQHLQPWLPVMAWPETTPRLATYDPLAAIGPWMQAVLAAASPYVDATAPEQSRYFEALRQVGTRRLFESADMDQLRVSMLLQFLLFGKGRAATEVWGIGMHLTQIAVRAGLHAEDHHVTAGQHMQRRLLGFDGKAQTWMDGETMRRLFWAIFLLDRFASLYSGVPPSIDAGEVRRLLPCEGRHWHRCEPVHTRDFVPASMVSVQPFGDVNLGAYAYLIEATEVLTTVSAFAARFGRGASAVKSRPDVRLFLKGFLELDVVLTNWKARLPAKYHHVSYNEDGYMDHNLTLAHMTHNTSSIMLYQSPRALFGLGAPGEALHRTLLPQCAIIKHGAKEIARICTRFLFHRRYLVSPQFAFCQFAAARALLAYASWTGEAVDEEYETLFTALAESAKRWAGVGHNHERSADVSRLDNFAAMLHSRLEYDMKRPAAIDLTIPVARLLEEAGITPSADGDGSAQALGLSPRYASGVPAEPSPEMEHIRGGLRTSPQVSSSAAGLLQNFVGGLGDEHHTMEVHNSEHLDDVLVQMALSGPESLDARLFSWGKGPAEWPAESEAC